MNQLPHSTSCLLVSPKTTCCPNSGQWFIWIGLLLLSAQWKRNQHLVLPFHLLCNIYIPQHANSDNEAIQVINWLYTDWWPISSTHCICLASYSEVPNKHVTFLILFKNKIPPPPFFTHTNEKRCPISTCFFTNTKWKKCPT